MTSTRRTIPAPPPNGVSSTCPPLSDVWSRGFSVRTSWPPASALATWRWARNHSNHSGNSVTTSSCMSAGLAGERRCGVAQERHVDVDDLGLDVDAAHRIADERDEELLAAPGHLERLAGRQRDEPPDAPELAVAVDDAAAHEVLGPPLVVLERRRGRAWDEQLEPAQLLDRLAALEPGEPHD